MTRCPDFTHLLVLPHLRVQNANAISSPLTHGFPALTAFVGLMWALERKSRTYGLDLSFKAVGVVCHEQQELASDGGFVKALRLTRNPPALREHKKLIKGAGDVNVPAIVEEGRIHLDLSLVLAVESERWRREPDSQMADSKRVAELLATMRIAGGTLLPTPETRRHRPYVIDLTGAEQDRQAEFLKARLRLLPGFALVARDDLLDRRLDELQADNPEATRLDAWLSLSRINWRYQSDGDSSKEGRWVHDREGLGWVLPIPVGYGALGELHPPGAVANARDATTPFRFVESLYSVGEWISPHRLASPQHMLWYPDSRPEDGLYRLRNDYRPAAQYETDFD